MRVNKTQIHLTKEKERNEKSSFNLKPKVDH